MEILLVGDLLFWIVTATVLLLLFVVVENNVPAVAILIVLAFTCLLQLFTDFHPFTPAFANPTATLVLLGLYFGIGVVWGALKWMSHVYEVHDKFLAFKVKRLEYYLSDMEFSVSNHLLTEAGGLTTKGMERIIDEACLKLRVKNIPLKIGDHKSQLLLWVTCWPLNATSTLLSGFCRFVCGHSARVLQRVSERAFADHVTCVPSPKEDA